MSRPLRPIFPKAGEAAQPHGQAEPSRTRRAHVALACQQCRTRKIKCDGQRPSCSACRSKDFECKYKESEDVTSLTELKRRYQELEQQYLELVELYGMLISRPEAEAYIILQRLRSSSDVRSTITFIKEGDLLIQHQPASASSAANVPLHLISTTESFLNMHHPKAYPQLPLPKEETASMGPRRTSIVEMDPEDYDLPLSEQIRNAKSLDKPHSPCDERLLHVQASQWTTVTTNNTVLVNLISLYLSWDHVTLRLFDEDYFLDQISTGQTEYCSPLLVNSMLAAAALNYSAVDREQSQTIGQAFFREAKRLWAVEEDEIHILKVPTALFMSMWCNWNGKKDMGKFYVSQASRVAQHLGLFGEHEENTQSSDLTSRKQQKAIAVIAWGFFNFQTINGFFGLSDTELPGLPSYPIPYDPLIHEDDQALWDPFPLVREKQVLCRGLVFKHLSELFKVLNAFLTGQSSTGAQPVFDRVKLLHGKMLAWADNLPHQLVYGSQSLPVILDLHMFYHGIVAKAFRPFTGKNCPYREPAKAMMKASVAQLKRLLYIQRYHFDGPPFNATTIGSVHILTFSLLEELARSQEVDRETSFDLILALQAMKKYGEAFPAIHKILQRLLERASRRHPELPPELKLVLEELGARYFGPDETNSGSGSESETDLLPIDFQIAMTDHSENDIEELIQVTYGLKLDHGRPLAGP